MMIATGGVAVGIGDDFPNGGGVSGDLNRGPYSRWRAGSKARSRPKSASDPKGYRKSRDAAPHGRRHCHG
jgi:hypothetical protein